MKCNYLSICAVAILLTAKSAFAMTLVPANCFSPEITDQDAMVQVISKLQFCKQATTEFVREVQVGGGSEMQVVSLIWGIDRKKNLCTQCYWESGTVEQITHPTSSSLIGQLSVLLDSAHVSPVVVSGLNANNMNEIHRQFPELEPVDTYPAKSGLSTSLLEPSALYGLQFAQRGTRNVVTDPSSGVQLVMDQRNCIVEISGRKQHPIIDPLWDVEKIFSDLPAAVWAPKVFSTQLVHRVLPVNEYSLFESDTPNKYPQYSKPFSFPQLLKLMLIFQQPFITAEPEFIPNCNVSAAQDVQLEMGHLMEIAREASFQLIKLRDSKPPIEAQILNSMKTGDTGEASKLTTKLQGIEKTQMDTEAKLKDLEATRLKLQEKINTVFRYSFNKVWSRPGSAP